MSYILEYTNTFKKDIKKAAKRGLNIKLIETAIQLLEDTGLLPAEYKPHKLVSNYKGYWEAHIQPDWLLIWSIDKDKGVITLVRTGTHSDLF